MVADRRLRHVAARLGLPALGRPRAGLAREPATRVRCRWARRRQAGERARRPTLRAAGWWSCGPTCSPSSRAFRRSVPWQPGPGRPRWSSGCAGGDHDARRCDFARSAPTLAEAALFGITGLDGLSTFGRLLISGDDPDQGPRRAASRAGGPRAAAGRPDRDRARSARAGAGAQARRWSPTSSPAGARPSTASRPRPYDGRSTPAGPPPRCTTSCPRPRARRSRSRSPTWSTTSRAGSAPCVPATPSRSCAATTRPR